MTQNYKEAIEKIDAKREHLMRLQLLAVSPLSQRILSLRKELNFDAEPKPSTVGVSLRWFTDWAKAMEGESQAKDRRIANLEKQLLHARNTAKSCHTKFISVRATLRQVNKLNRALKDERDGSQADLEVAEMFNQRAISLLTVVVEKSSIVPEENKAAALELLNEACCPTYCESQIPTPVEKAQEELRKLSEERRSLRRELKSMGVAR